MKIQNYSPIKYTQINFQAKKAFSLRQLTKDVFQKTTSPIKKTQEISQEISEKDIEKLYDEVFDFTIKNNPILKEFGIEKPKLEFKDLGTSDACYNFLSNTISIGNKYNDDAYAYLAYDEAGTIIDTRITSKNTIDNELSEIKSIASRFEVLKLTQDEKKMYLKSILAHELRHWVQEHILVLTKGCEEHYEYRIGLVNKLLDAYKEIIETSKQCASLKSSRKKYQKTYKEAKNRYAYILNLAPKRALDENHKMNVSFYSYDKRQWSIKEHLLPASLKYSNSDDNEYKNNPIEIDAFNYQCEFLMEEKFSEKNQNVRDNVFSAMIVSSGAKSAYYLDNMEKLGYPKLITPEN